MQSVRFDDHHIMNSIRSRVEEIVRRELVEVD